MSDKIKRIDIKEFRKLGFLQELNRQFLHPLGLALEVVIEDDGSERLGKVWDYRDDPEGMLFQESSVCNVDFIERASSVLELYEQKAKVRQQKFGYVIQPVGEPA